MKINKDAQNELDEYVEAYRQSLLHFAAGIREMQAKRGQNNLCRRHIIKAKEAVHAAIAKESSRKESMFSKAKIENKDGTA